MDCWGKKTAETGDRTENNGLRRRRAKKIISNPPNLASDIFASKKFPNPLVKAQALSDPSVFVENFPLIIIR